MIRDWRETTLTVPGERTVVRTEIGGQIKTQRQLEDAHTKAVKAAITAARVKSVEWQYADRKQYAETMEKSTYAAMRSEWGAPYGPMTEHLARLVDMSMRRRVREAHADAETFRNEGLKNAARFVAHGAQDVRKMAAPWPAVKYVTPEQAKVTEYLDTDD